MDLVEGVRQRRYFRWSREARDLVRDYKERMTKNNGSPQIDRRMLVAKLCELSGNPRDACSRLLRNSGVLEKRSYREWTKPEQQRLLDLITTMPVVEAAKILRRPAGSVRSMLHRLGMGGQTGRDWFTKFSLSRALHTRPDEIQKWIDLGWLRSRPFTAEGVQAQIIDADDFCEFVKQHGRQVVGRRLTYDALWFVQNYVFPPSHAELLSVRGKYKKRAPGEATEGTAVGQSDPVSEA
jgi:hypothetical protein